MKFPLTVKSWKWGNEIKQLGLKLKNPPTFYILAWDTRIKDKNGDEITEYTLYPDIETAIPEIKELLSRGAATDRIRLYHVQIIKDKLHSTQVPWDQIAFQIARRVRTQ